MTPAWQEYTLFEAIAVSLSGLLIAVLIFVAALAQGWFLWWQFRTRSLLLQALTWAWCGLLVYGLALPWLERPLFGGLFAHWDLNTAILALTISAVYLGLIVGVRLALVTHRAAPPPSGPGERS
jgi:hypothetical protein